MNPSHTKIFRSIFLIKCLCNKSDDQPELPTEQLQIQNFEKGGFQNLKLGEQNKCTA